MHVYSAPADRPLADAALVRSLSGFDATIKAKTHARLCSAAAESRVFYVVNDSGHVLAGYSKGVQFE